MNQRENAALAERSARRALYSCLFSIVVCAVMLFGTTFAWFTANRTSGVNNMTAANFDVTIDNPNLSAGENTVTLRRTGSGVAPGYCVIKLDYMGSYTVTSGTITYTTDENGETTSTANDTSSETFDGSGSQTYFAVFDGTNTTVSFTVNLNNGYTASIEKTKAEWGTYPTSPGTVVQLRSSGMKRLMAAPTQLKSVSAADSPQELVDGATLPTIGQEDIENITIETIKSEVPLTEQTTVERVEANNNNEDGLKDGTKVDAGSGNGNENNESSGIDSNGGADSGSDSGGGSGSSGGGSGTGGSTGESSGGEGGGESSSSGTVTGTDTGTNTDAGTGDTGSTDTGDTGSTGNGDET